MHIARWKILIIISICLLSFVVALPNAGEKIRAHWPAWLPARTLSLGLDLQGGVHFLLDVDMDHYMADQSQLLRQQLRKTLRDEHIGYHHLVAHADQVSFSLRDSVSSEKLRKIIRTMNPRLHLTMNEGKATIGWDSDQRADMLRHVLDQSIEIVRRRVDETGTREPLIQRQGESRIVVQVPGMHDPSQLRRLLGKTAKLGFHLVSGYSQDPSELVPTGMKRLSSDRNQAASSAYIIEATPRITGDMLEDASTAFNQGLPAVSFRLNYEGAKIFAEITREYVGRPFAIVLDETVISAPVINEPITGGSGIISGNFTVASANELAMLLRAGALPAPLHIIEERTVGPSLGADSIAAGTKAAIVGMLAVLVFMVASYGLFGVFANIALVINMVIIIAVLTLFQATLTMPGIAALVLTLGMAVDANVLIFERIREELRHKGSVSIAVERGFHGAMSAIMDSNITTILTALLLYIFGAGPVQGFAVNLTIGIFSSMFAAIVLTRLFIVMWVKSARPKTLLL